MVVVFCVGVCGGSLFSAKKIENIVRRFEHLQFKSVNKRSTKDLEALVKVIDEFARKYPDLHNKLEYALIEKVREERLFSSLYSIAQNVTRGKGLAYQDACGFLFFVNMALIEKFERLKKKRVLRKEKFNKSVDRLVRNFKFLQKDKKLRCHLEIFVRDVNQVVLDFPQGINTIYSKISQEADDKFLVLDTLFVSRKKRYRLAYQIFHMIKRDLNRKKKEKFDLDKEIKILKDMGFGIDARSDIMWYLMNEGNNMTVYQLFEWCLENNVKLNVTETIWI